MIQAELETIAPVRHQHLDAVAELVVRAHQAAPAAVVACAWNDDGRWRLHEGAAGHLFPEGPRASPDTPFDLASVTKPFTAAALARLIRSELIAWSTPLCVLVREALGTPSSDVELELLLAHRSGLDGHRPLYAPLEQGREVNRYEALRLAASARRADCAGAVPAHGFSPLYSDLGYLLLGEGMARAARCSLDKLVEREVCAPLQLGIFTARGWRERDPAYSSCVAPTEVVAWRGGVVRGVVHDENAWALSGEGMCAHAGLFGRARDVARFGAAIVDVMQGRLAQWLTPDELEPLVRCRAGGTLRAGFDGKSEGNSSAGAACASSAFGHLGFTGTSMWIDPQAQVVMVLLSNRVHPTRSNEAIKKARPVVHDALFQWAREQSRG